MSVCMGMISSCSFFVLRFYRAVVMVGFLCLLVVGCVSEGRRTRTSQSVLPRLKNRDGTVGKEKPVQYHSDSGFDLDYMLSKRKIPNGPDPIHNRRAGNSGRPPGKA